MKTRIFVVVVAAMMVAACSAFDNNNKPYDGFGPDIVPPPGVGGGAYEGVYKGELKLIENACVDLVAEIDSTEPLEVDIVQSGDLVSMGFEDDTEASGSVTEGKATIIKRDVSNVMIFHIEFVDGAISGECSYIEGAPLGDQLGEPCAKYSVSLTRE